MSNAALNWAFEMTVGSPASKSVLIALANRANSEGTCWPGIECLKADTELSRRSVIAQVKKLQALGLISIEHRGGDGKGRKSNVYLLHLGGNVHDVHQQCAPPAQLSAPPAPEPIIEPEGEPSSNTNSLREMFIKIPLKDGTIYTPEKKDILRWRSTYPTLDLCEHLKLCADWNEVNPSKRKTRRGIRSHISKWLSNVGKPPPWAQDLDVDPNEGRHQLLT